MTSHISDFSDAKAGRVPRQRLRRALTVIPLSASLSLLVALFFIVAAVSPTLLATHDPFSTDLLNALQAPSFAHWLGTDDIGRDLYSRIIWGTRQSLAIGLGAMAIALVGAIVLGFSAALAPRWHRAGLPGRLTACWKFCWRFPRCYWRCCLWRCWVLLPAAC
ncbi:hypothetical protein [Erwinia billingiae]|uniref:hypothetical protein n=1 Tax=Erwinia billingiae TaxID=182337 RepID=UPI00215887B1|nr:hypothetical protein [Erwinia billingiae]